MKVLIYGINLYKLHEHFHEVVVQKRFAFQEGNFFSFLYKSENKRENAQVPPQPMPEIQEVHLYYTKVILPPLNFFCK